jgi:DNA (cytosine-5)-methyltransferase 1
MIFSINNRDAITHLLTDSRLEFNENARAVVSHWLQSPETPPIGVPKASSPSKEEWCDSLTRRAWLETRSPLNDKAYKYPENPKLRIKFSDVPFPPPSRPAFTFIDLFAGIGGFRLALQKLNGKCVFSSEWERHAQYTYFLNYGEFPFGDIKEFTNETLTDDDIRAFIPSHDILAAGFPCQPFSRAGVSARESLGKEHGFSCYTQGTLFFDIVRIANALRPKVLILENVQNIKSHDKGHTFKVIKKTIEEELGYSFYDTIIDASSFVAQRRKRCFMVCFRDRESHLDFDIPAPKGDPIPLKTALEDRVDEKYTLSPKMWAGHQRRTKRNLERGAGFTAFLADIEKPSNTIVSRYWKDGKECLVRQGEGKLPRMLTPSECKKLMGFPEDFKMHPSDNFAYRQFGNGVVVPAVTHIAKNVLNELGYKY